MKIIHVIESYANTGGVVIYLQSLLPELKDIGCDVSVLCQQANNDVRPDSGIDVITVTNEQDVYSNIKKIKPDVVHIHGWATACLLKKFEKIKKPYLIVHLHDYGFLCPGTQYYWRNQKVNCDKGIGMRCLSHAYTKQCQNSRKPSSIIQGFLQTRRGLKYSHRADKFLANSAFMKKKLLEQGLPNKKIEVLNYFIKIRANPKEQTITGRILYVGRLAESKGLDLLIEALVLLKNREDWALDIVGDGYARGSIIAMLEKYNMLHRVRLLGWLNGAEKFKRYNQASVVVLPSRWPEAFGIVGIEAMACGKPVVAFDVGGISDWLEDGITGYLVKPFDVNEFSQRICDCLDHTEKTELMAKNSLASANNNFNPDNHVKKLLKIYKNLGY